MDDMGPISVVDAFGTFALVGPTAYFGLLDIGRPNEGETVTRTIQLCDDLNAAPSRRGFYSSRLCYVPTNPASLINPNVLEAKMNPTPITPARKKKIKTLLSMMNKQGQRLLPVAPPLVEMMDLVTTDDELDYLLKMGTGLYTYQQAAQVIKISDEQFQSFFDTMKRKGLVFIQYDDSGNEKYRLNAIAVGWYEIMMYYMMDKPHEKTFSEKWNEYFKFFKKFNFYPIRKVQNLVLRHFLKPTQQTALFDQKIKDKSKRKTIPINITLSPSGEKVYPTFYVNEIIEKYGDQNAIFAFPCICRHGKNLTESSCNFDMPRESCLVFGKLIKTYEKMGYARNISKAEAIGILKEVRDKGAVHSVFHEKDDLRLPVLAICNCCWDCCALLKTYNMGAIALKYNASFTARIKKDTNCKECGNCAKYCPTAAIALKNGKVSLNSEKCIGCGQCAYQCKQNNIELYANERTVYLPMLKKSEARITA
jgi:Pyruvate/2-oxoacid:ferredoxin oxidoreductase delta subunit